eukprot:SM000006S19333  [mRNA]  locus=s6:167360:169290:+ [translate_table: standard]
MPPAPQPRPRRAPPPPLLLLLLPAAALLLLLLPLLAPAAMAGLLGAPKDAPDGGANDAEVEELAKFAVEQHNAKEGAGLAFGRVLSAKQQVVAGTLHLITLEASSSGDGGGARQYEAKVWTKPWENHRSLEAFQPLGGGGGGDGGGATAADLGALPSGSQDNEDMKDVPSDDPAVADAVEFAVKKLQEQSNSLAPYELQDILSSKAQASQQHKQSISCDLGKVKALLVGQGTTFHTTLKLKRGTAEEVMNVEVHRTPEGSFTLKKAAPHKK